MEKFNLVSAQNMKTLEQYGAAVILGLASLKTLESFHVQAFAKGLLDNDEMETGKTICWEIQRLIALYRTQVEHIVDRTGLDEKLVIAHLQTLLPDITAKKVSRAKKKVSQNESEPIEKSELGG
jgi:hypothetical protein